MTLSVLPDALIMYLKQKLFNSLRTLPHHFVDSVVKYYSINNIASEWSKYYTDNTKGLIVILRAFYEGNYMENTIYAVVVGGTDINLMPEKETKLNSCRISVLNAIKWLNQKDRIVLLWTALNIQCTVTSTAPPGYHSLWKETRECW